MEKNKQNYRKLLRSTRNSLKTATKLNFRTHLNQILLESTGAVPYTVHTARRVPLPLLPKVQKELQRMEEQGVIVKVTQPTDWCAPMVPVLKTTVGQQRICVALQKLNENLRRERYQLPTIEETLAKLSGSTVFTSLDAASGFWQILLHEDSCLLTTFITPFG